MNQKSILFLFSMCLAVFSSFGQIVSTESFNAVTFPPTGWSIKPTIAPQNPWTRQTSPGANPTTASHSGAGMARYRRNLTAGTKQILVTRAIDYTLRGTSAANLDFWMYRDSLAAADFDSLRVFVNSTDTLDATAVYLGTIARNRNISIPDTQHVNGWYHFVYAIPSTFTGTTTRFIFEGTSQSTTTANGANIYVDDISFDEFPAICTGTPNVGNITTPTPLICGGSGTAALSLSAPITGVTGLSYNWESGASITGPWTSVGTNATLTTAVLTSTTYFRCTVLCSFSALSYTTPVDSIVVSTNTPPVLSVTPGTGVLCPGTTGIELVVTGAVSYSWTPATGLNVTNNDTVIASPTVNTQYIVLGTAADGCTDTAMVNVTLNAGPTLIMTATPNDTVCVGQQVILNCVQGPTTGYTYLWSNGITSRRDTIVLAATTTYSVIVTNAAGCSNSDSITIVATPATVANFGYTNSGYTFTFSDSSINAASWTWTFDGGNSSISQNPTYTFSAPGTYTVTLHVTGTSCNDDSITKVITVWPLAVQDVNDLTINYYPNPVHDNLQIELNNQMVESVVIRNNIGQSVANFTNSSNNKSISLPLAKLTAGVYFAEVVVNGQKHQIKFIKD